MWTLDGYVTVDTTNMPATWSTYSLSITIDANHPLAGKDLIVEIEVEKLA